MNASTFVDSVTGILKIVGFGVLYIVYLTYSCCTDVVDNKRCLTNVTDFDTTINNIKQALQAPPVVKLTIKCYHYAGYSKNGHVKNKNPVDTHYAEEIFPYNQWADKSPPIEALQHID